MVRKLLTIAAAGAMAVAPVAAQAAAPLSVAHDSARAGATLDDAGALRGRNSAVFIGLILVVIFLAIVTADGRDEPDNIPDSP